MQVLAEEMPLTRHDVPLDYVVTPEEIIRCGDHCGGALPHPSGVYWDDLDEAKISEIPLLHKLREQEKAGRISR